MAGSPKFTKSTRQGTRSRCQIVHEIDGLIAVRIELPQSTVTCNLDLMRENPAFQTEVMNNMGRTFGLLSQAATEIERYEAVKKLIEERTH